MVKENAMKKETKKAKESKEIEETVPQDLYYHSLATLVDNLLMIRKTRESHKVHLSHLDKLGKKDPESAAMLTKIAEMDDYLLGRIKMYVSRHPCMPWFNRVSGVGMENISKVISFIDWDRVKYISSLWQYAGYGADKDDKTGDFITQRKRKGFLCTYNAELKTMCWRLGTNLLKAGVRRGCIQCNATFGSTEDVPATECPKCGSENFSQVPGASKIRRSCDDCGKKFNSTKKKARTKCPKCGSEKFGKVGITKYAAYYLKMHAQETSRILGNGGKIVKSADLPVDSENKKYEPEGVFSELHVHNRAFRKMIKLFLGNLVMVYWEVNGIEQQLPWSHVKLGHKSLITPWEMCDHEEPINANDMDIEIPETNDDDDEFVMSIL